MYLNDSPQLKTLKISLMGISLSVFSPLSTVFLYIIDTFHLLLPNPGSVLNYSWSGFVIQTPGTPCSDLSPAQWAYVCVACECYRGTTNQKYYHNLILKRRKRQYVVSTLIINPFSWCQNCKTATLLLLGLIIRHSCCIRVPLGW